MAQNDLPPIPKGRNSTAASSSLSDSTTTFFHQAVDTLHIKTYYASQPHIFHPYPDTLLGFQLHQPDLTRRQTIDYIHLGSLGTPAYPLVFSTYERQGLDIGFHEYDLYRRKKEDIKYFIINETFLDASYGQEHTKDDFSFKTTFAKNLSPTWSLSVDYDRISHEGIYKHQKSRHTAFVINTAYRSKKRYQSFMSFSYNDFQQQHNGGVKPNANFSASFYSNRNNIPVYLTTANTRMQENIYAYSQYYNLRPHKKRQLRLGHELVYENGEYKFYDTNPANDSLFYGDLQVYNKGLRQYLKWQQFENTFKINISKPDSTQSSKELLDIGLIQQYQFVHQEPIDTSVNNVMLFGEWSNHLSRYLSWHLYARYNIGKNSNEYLLKGQLQFHLGAFGTLKGEVMQQRFSPSLVQHQMYISTLPLYQNQFKKQLTTNLQAGYHLPRTQTQFSVQYHLLNNYIYFNEKSLPSQSSSNISILQLILQQDISLGKWTLENTLVYQTDNSEIIRLPRLFLKNSLYWKGYLFKQNMHSKIGLDFRTNTPYYANSFQPLTGQFHLQNDTKIAMYPAVDIFAAFKVKRFRAYAKYENIIGWFSDKIFYQTPNYPLADPHFVFGVSWIFVD